jgi:glutaredoxin
VIVRVEGDVRAIVAALTRDQPECVTLFGADWCGDCRRAKTWLTKHEVPFTAIDTQADAAERERAAALAGGRHAIPVLVAPHGTVLVEPTNLELTATLISYRRRRGAATVRCR